MIKKMAKDQVINLRVTVKQKEKIKQAEHPSFNIVEGGKELAQEVHRLNKNLEHFLKYPFIPVQELRDTVSQGIQKISDAMKEGF